ncbi:MAG: diacylglycerol kinase [Gammaproteobacteria bacterium]|jgi:diacylglycerol kinase (ATP)|nr:diacylglycerol kinase [Gammaproteobacteria bacterium]MBT4780983.1 diacylglycerol kinase [Gammaproteobacteria bacterium]MBT5907194.1 diacylglycerol kinase [Gammaproteobacteria bacterium]MBT6316521.1 diacylglycerol kinase [Gammaproteobacteria bacterium]MDG2163745.1 diacylglycerol kinase [Gammaproteobacteria bacterium]
MSELSGKDRAAESEKELTAVPAKKKGFARLRAATVYSVEGLRACFASEEAFRLEIMLAVVLTPLAFWLGDSPAERGLLLVAIVLVLLVELLNSAIEAVVDRIGLEYHALSKKAKDIGSAAVFISLVAFVVLWVAVLL